MCSQTLRANKMSRSWLRRHPEERCQATHQQGRQPQIEYVSGTSRGEQEKWYGPKIGYIKWQSPEGLSPRDLLAASERAKGQL